MDKSVIYIGAFAGILTAISLLPQLIKIIRNKKADEISLAAYIILMLGLSGWIAYGVLRQDWPVILTNAFSVCINILILIFSAKYKASAA